MVLKERCNDYEKELNELYNENQELKAQIERMKCCQNCKNGLYSGQGCIIGFKCENKNKWELAE